MDNIDGLIFKNETNIVFCKRLSLLLRQQLICLYFQNMVDDGPVVGEDAFVWLGSLVPLACDVVNGRFTFETLTASTADRLHFPAYDKYLKEINK